MIINAIYIPDSDGRPLDKDADRDKLGYDEDSIEVGDEGISVGEVDKMEFDANADPIEKITVIDAW